MNFSGSKFGLQGSKTGFASQGFNMAKPVVGAKQAPISFDMKIKELPQDVQQHLAAMK